MTREQFLIELGTIVGAEKTLDMKDALASLPTWDSMAIISFIALVDEQFHLVLPAEKVYEAQTVEHLLNLVLDHLDK